MHPAGALSIPFTRPASGGGTARGRSARCTASGSSPAKRADHRQSRVEPIQPVSLPSAASCYAHGPAPRPTSGPRGCARSSQRPRQIGQQGQRRVIGSRATCRNLLPVAPDVQHRAGPNRDKLHRFLFSCRACFRVRPVSCVSIPAPASMRPSGPPVRLCGPSSGGRVRRRNPLRKIQRD